MNGVEIGNLVATGFINGILQGVKILAPYFILFCVACVVIGIIKKKLRKK